MKNNDKYFMKLAIKEAKKAGNDVFPNPKVGCLIVKDGKVVSKGFHKRFGGRHAEQVAIDNLPQNITKTTMYVTLEPCAHKGKTNPCIDLIDPLVINRVVISSLDPNPSASGGINAILNKKISVTKNICTIKSKKINQRFFTYHEKKRPYIIIKAALTLDGFIAESNGVSKWITNEESRQSVHFLRSSCDAILIGNKTAIIDNPSLDSHGKGKDPIPVIIDRSKSMKKSLKIFKKNPIILSSDILNNKPVDNIKIILDELYKRNIQSVLVEGGGFTITHFLDSGFFDELHLYYAPKFLGSGLSIFSTIKSIKDSSNLVLKKVDKFNNDFRVIYKRKY